ncbi:sorbitol dehydrogenase-like [Galleria mellonella]|uniref:Sorbitol dehydrogenase n=1 Tax=Galleria mellonella TaxID=7137 RepID=A0A6J1WA53_GALME|nr:sorbitol dehydrogenase-like [Galleria mellonella]
MDKNYAALLSGPRQLKIVEWPIPNISSNEVLIKMDSVGICGSDVKKYSTYKNGVIAVKKPMIMGHEGAGVVVKVGAEVRNVKVGDRVAIEPTQPCRSCEYCKTGKYNMCVDGRYCSSSGNDGNLCTYYKHVADFVHKIPDNLTLEEGAAVQPLAVAIHACNRAGVKLGSEVVILGAGPIGVLCAMTARAMGATKILITDIIQARLDVAKEMGVDFTLLVDERWSDEETVDRIVRLLGCRPTITIDACAFPSPQRVALLVTRTCGVVLIVGISSESLTQLPLSDAMLREVDIRGSHRIANTYPAALAAVSSGIINLKPLITHHFPLRQAQAALEQAKAGEGMKIIIRVQD